ncbi:hypothetical protein D3C77_755490 [compost metagenome]
MQQNGEDDGHGEEQHEFEGDDRVHVTLTEIGEIRRIFAIGLITQHHIGNTAKQAHRADGDDDGWQFEASDEKAVERPAE